jgi:hypothetical protein
MLWVPPSIGHSPDTVVASARRVSSCTSEASKLSGWRSWDCWRTKSRQRSTMRRRSAGRWLLPKPSSALGEGRETVCVGVGGYPGVVGGYPGVFGGYPGVFGGYPGVVGGYPGGFGGYPGVVGGYPPVTRIKRQ